MLPTIPWRNGSPARGGDASPAVIRPGPAPRRSRGARPLRPPPPVGRGRARGRRGGVAWTRPLHRHNAVRIGSLDPHGVIRRADAPRRIDAPVERVDLDGEAAELDARVAGRRPDLELPGEELHRVVPPGALDLLTHRGERVLPVHHDAPRGERARRRVVVPMARHRPAGKEPAQAVAPFRRELGFLAGGAERRAQQLGSGLEGRSAPREEPVARRALLGPHCEERRFVGECARAEHPEDVGPFSVEEGQGIATLEKRITTRPRKREAGGDYPQLAAPVGEVRKGGRIGSGGGRQSGLRKEARDRHRGVEGVGARPGDRPLNEHGRACGEGGCHRAGEAPGLEGSPLETRLDASEPVRGELRAADHRQRGRPVRADLGLGGEVEPLKRDLGGGLPWGAGHSRALEVADGEDVPDDRVSVVIGSAGSIDAGIPRSRGVRQHGVRDCERRGLDGRGADRTCRLFRRAAPVGERRREPLRGRAKGGEQGLPTVAADRAIEGEEPERGEGSAGAEGESEDR